MIRKSLLTFIFFLLALTWAHGENTPPADAAAQKAPRIDIAEKHYHFEKVLEGTPVFHDFVIKNRGTSDLDILKVNPG